MKPTPNLLECALVTETSGNGSATVNETSFDDPAAVDTLMLRTPFVALLAIANVAVRETALTTVTLLTVMPATLFKFVAPNTKFVPVRVTLTEPPLTPIAGLMLVSVG